MSNTSSFKWQVPIHSHVSIPCRRGIYNIALSGLVLHDIPNTAANDILHVCISPYAENTSVWLRGAHINSIKTIVRNSEKSTVFIQYQRDELDFYKVDLTANFNLFNVSVVDILGHGIPGTGFAVFELIADNNCG